MKGALTAAAGRGVDVVLEASVVASFSRIGCRVRRRVFDWEVLPAGSMAGQVAVVTGATGGLGAAIATALSRLGATVWLLGRDRDRTAALADRIRAQVPGADPRIGLADLTRLSAVREVAENLLRDTERLDVLIHNAGALAPAYERTVDGLEATVQTQVVAPFLLTALLLPRLRTTPGARVITVSSGGMYTQRLEVDALDPDPATFDGVSAYAWAKRAQVVLTQEWARRAHDSGVTFHVTHPGWVDTPGLRTSLPRFGRLMGPVLRSPEEGADTIVWLAGSRQVRGNGEFWHDRRARSTIRLPGTSTPAGEADRLWEWTRARAGLPATTAGPS